MINTKCLHKETNTKTFSKQILKNNFKIENF